MGRLPSATDRPSQPGLDRGQAAWAGIRPTPFTSVRVIRDDAGHHMGPLVPWGGIGQGMEGTERHLGGGTETTS